MRNNSLKKTIDHSIAAKKSLLLIEDKINQCIKIIYKKLLLGGKIFLCGNGGSAADAQHLAAEFLVRLDPKRNRRPIPAISLATDISTITACGNDYSFNKIFSRNLEALGSKNDVLIVISTSGKSRNILEVLKIARKKKFTVSASWKKWGEAKKFTDLSLSYQRRSVAKNSRSTYIIRSLYI